MLHILKNENKFTVFFFTLLAIDIVVKLNCPAFPYRYISKPPIVLMLFFYYFLNNAEKDKKKYLFIILGLASFLIGDVLVINHTNIIFLGTSLFFFSLAKIFLSLNFSHKFDFQISKLVPFSLVLFIYTVWIVSFLYDSLASFFIPALLSFFLSLLLFQFAFLRMGVVDKRSYLYVLIGIVLYLFSESMMAIKTFKTDIPMQDSLIMFFYGAALYLVTVGIVKEKRIKKVVNVS